ncbi:nuclear speckle splicing regulatory protein 1-like isoform X2 [Zophobas morio]|uniref:nuclear speckle splicing regulatory protein 1-like isoform X2 n=1 Tax=Zophobas morio TaxID=2755281 RepID=UPI003083BDDD
MNPFKPKKFGLVLRPTKKNENHLSKVHTLLNNAGNTSIFEGSSEEEETEVKSKVNYELRQPRVLKGDDVALRKALEEDASIFEYDAVYEKISSANKIFDASTLNRKPKYYEALLKGAHLRKLENERRIDRQEHKKRIQEKEEFVGKEVIVTASYKKKLAERQLAEELEKQKEALEEAQNVSRKSDLSAFYASLLNNSFDFEDPTSKLKEDLEGKIFSSSSALAIGSPTMSEEINVNKEVLEKNDYAFRENSFLNEISYVAKKDEVCQKAVGQFKRKTVDSVVEVAKRKAMERRLRREKHRSDGEPPT